MQAGHRASMHMHGDFTPPFPNNILSFLHSSQAQWGEGERQRGMATARPGKRGFETQLGNMIKYIYIYIYIFNSMYNLCIWFCMIKYWETKTNFVQRPAAGNWKRKQKRKFWLNGGVPLHSEIETGKEIHKSKTIATSFLLHNMISKWRGTPLSNTVIKIQAGSSPTMISEWDVTPSPPLTGLPKWSPWTSFTKVTKIDFYFLPICHTWLLPMSPRWDCLNFYTNMSAPLFFGSLRFGGKRKEGGKREIFTCHNFAPFYMTGIFVDVFILSNLG